MEHGGVNADANCRIACLDALKRGARREGTIGYYAHRQAASATGVADVGAEGF